MGNLAFRSSAVALTFALLAMPVVAFAQTGTPTRVGNIWDWRNHQPTETQVQQKEKAAGIAPTRSQGDSTAAIVDQLYQQLLHRSPT
jgi:hypothetical protein